MRVHAHTRTTAEYGSHPAGLYPDCVLIGQELLSTLVRKKSETEVFRRELDILQDLDRKSSGKLKYYMRVRAFANATNRNEIRRDNTPHMMNCCGPKIYHQHEFIQGRWYPTYPNAELVMST